MINLANRDPSNHARGAATSSTRATPDTLRDRARGMTNRQNYEHWSMRGKEFVQRSPDARAFLRRAEHAGEQLTLAQIHALPSTARTSPVPRGPDKQDFTRADQTA